MSKVYENVDFYESGYNSDSSEECTETTLCQFCNKNISGPRLGMVVHYATKHTQTSRLQISKITTASELHTFVIVRKRTLDLLL